MAAELPLETLVQRIEAHLVVAPSIGVTIADDLRGYTSATRTHTGLRVQRETTINVGPERDASRSMVDDVIVIELSFRIAPKDQRTSRDAAYTLARAIRNRITDLTEITLRPSHCVHIDDDEEVEGDWIVITSRYNFSRIEEVGQG